MEVARARSLEDFALVEGTPALVGALPAKVLLDQLLGLSSGEVQLLPLVHLVVDLETDGLCKLDRPFVPKSAAWSVYPVDH